MKHSCKAAHRICSCECLRERHQMVENCPPEGRWQISARSFNLSQEELGFNNGGSQSIPIKNIISS